MSTTVDYDGRWFGPSGDDASAGLYHQTGDLVWAEFSGPSVRTGRLVGVRRADGVIDASYCYLTAGGEPVAGAVVSTPELLPDGRIRLTERWHRLDGASGVSEIEEIVEGGTGDP